MAADSVYGVGEFEVMLRRAGKGYVLGVHANHRFNSWSTEVSVAGKARDTAAAVPAGTWTRLSAGHGTKGERLYEWTYYPLADLDAVDQEALAGLWTRGLLIRRSVGEGDLAAYFTTWCPKGTSIATLVRVEGTRWRIEEGFESARTSLASTTTRPAPGTVGTGTFRWSCWPMRSWPPCGPKPTP